jgi:hypothetical protein
MFQFFNGKSQRILGIILLFSFVFSLSTGVFGFAKPAEAGTISTWGKRILTAGLIGTGLYAGAQAYGKAEEIINSFDLILIALFKGISDFFGGTIFRWLVPFLIKAAAYNGFLDAQAVSTGWVIVRDIGNMFFVLILLVIAVATILRVEAYSYKKLLPKLVLMAVLINFSKTICGIIIDFSQVIMLTFVNAFKAASAQNFWQTFGLHKLYSFESLEEQAGADPEKNWDVTGAAFLAFLVIFISVLTIGVLTIFLVIRIVMLWTLIILSPLAFLLASFPAGQKYAAQWWEQFSKYVLVGPALAFFIWLALLVAGGGNANTQVGAEFAEGEYVPPATATDLADPNVLSSLVVGNVLLLVGLVFAQKLGIVGSGVAGAALSGLRRAGTMPAKLAWRGAKGGLKLGWKGIKAGVGASWNKAAEIRYAKTGKSLIFSKVNRDMKERRKKELYGDRVLRGQMTAGERAAGARGMIDMAAVMWGDPSMRGKLGMWGTLRAIGQAGKGGRFADMAKQHGELAKRKAEYERLATDPVGTFKKSKEMDLTREQQALAEKSQKAKDLREKNKDKLGQMENLGREKNGLNGEIKSLEEAIRGLDSSIADLGTRTNVLTAKEEKYETATTEELIREIPYAEEEVEYYVGKGYEEKEAREEVVGKYRAERLSDIGAEITLLKTNEGSLTRERADRKTDLDSKKAKLGTVDVEFGKLQADAGVQNIIKLETEVRAHKANVSEIEGVLKKPVGEMVQAAREHRKELLKQMQFTGAGLSADSLELQMAQKDLTAEVKRALTERAGGKEPTGEEVERAIREMHYRV